ncbi:LCP family protein [Arthrobacter castelli]|uniref:LCP family protein n=1 Tax=Arthrobacter castelli TaxID=271431 RepID=UPI00040B9E20|nr:LCP family protein [Arthrobacter castelli]
MSNVFDQPDSYDEQPRKRHTTRNVLFVFLGLFLIAALVAGTYIYNLANTFNNSTQKIETAFPDESSRPTKEPEDKNPGPEAVNILLMGSDTRADMGNLTSGSPTGERSDTIMLMHIPPDRENVYVMSIMRDLWVEIPGHGMNKINAAMSFGGIPLTVQTIEGMFDDRIDHVAVIDFQGFKALTEALGGVTVNVPYSFSTGEYAFEAGPMTLEGEQALAFVRERKAFSSGDYQRVANQQIFVKALLSEFLNAKTLTNPGRISDVVKNFAPYISVDEQLDAGRVGELAFSLRGVRSDDVKMFTLPTQGTGTSDDGQSIVLKDEQAIERISQALDDGTLGQYLQSQGLVNSGG